MKEQALAVARQAKDPEEALNRIREYLQAHILRSLHECEAFLSLAFTGGTALRFLYGLPRFSEDLDFSLVSPAGYDGREWLAKVKRDLLLSGFQAEVTWNDRKVVNTSWIRVAGLLQEAGLSSHSDQKLSVKLEIDTSPPQGDNCAQTIITRHMTFLLRHYDLPTLLSGKLHALICRAYPKGRDWYDLVWYRSQIPPIEPNLVFLQNALDQTNPKKRVDAAQWRDEVRQRLLTYDIDHLRADVRPFLEHFPDADLLRLPYFLQLLENP